MNEHAPATSSYLGRHTTLSYVIKRRMIWRRIPYLRDNDGRAPPLVLAVGDRRRVYAIARRLRKPVLLSEAAAKLSSQTAGGREWPTAPEYGRVAMAVGLVSSSVPVLVVETQMGAPATQIIMNEVFSDELTSTDYQVGKAKISLPHKVVIRVGTAGGINCEAMPTINVGDIVNATHSIGATGAVIQSLLRLDFWRPGAMEDFREKWLSLGPDFSITEDGHPRVECSADVVKAIDSAGKQLAGRSYHKGGNATKDSLYAELSLETFVNLCRTQSCRSTEMELSAIAVSARQNNAHFGMMSAIVGILPGSFAESERAKAAAERKAMRVALEAIKNLVQNE